MGLGKGDFESDFGILCSTATIHNSLLARFRVNLELGQDQALPILIRTLLELTVRACWSGPCCHSVSVRSIAKEHYRTERGSWKSLALLNIVTLEENSAVLYVG
jgi:hypothetical protein